MCVPEAVAKEFEVTASLGVALVMSRLPWSAIVTVENGTSAWRQFGIFDANYR